MAENPGKIVDFCRARGVAEAESLYQRAQERVYQGDFDHLIDWSENIDPNDVIVLPEDTTGSVDDPEFTAMILKVHDQVMAELREEAVLPNPAPDMPRERGPNPPANDNGVERQGT